MLHRAGDERFVSGFVDLCRSELAELDRVRSIDDFLGQAETVTSLSFGGVSITRYPLRHAEVLVALGRFADALAVLAPALRDEEATSSRILASGKAELAKKPRSALAKHSIEHATLRLQLVARLKPLLSLLKANDRLGIVAMLRSHEQRNAKLWNVEHTWQPSPFPFESAQHPPWN